MQLANERFESFARNVALGYSKTEAARRAGYSEGGVNNVGSRLAKNRTVAERIAQLRSTVDPTNIASREWILSEVIENHRLARKAKDYNVSKQCLELLARMQGYLVNRSETYSESLKMSLESSDYRQLNGILRQSLASVPAADRELLLAEVPEEMRSTLRLSPAEAKAIEGEESE